ncbi:MAG TPA: hypothetical protein VKK79_13765, partial [Candidatus Lokiarchaeia archaeon]|nr:hypothetical protein [Candidatus Lokiarchaeia archaeon]
VGDEKFDYVEVVLRKLMADPSEQVRILGAKAVALIGKANPVLLQADPEYIEMVDLIIQDTSEEVREKAVDLFTYLSKVNPSMLIFNIPIKMLSKNFSVESCRTLMRVIHNIAEEFPWEEDIDLILKPLLAFNREDELVRNKIVEIIFVIIRGRFQTFAQLYPLLKEFLLDESDMVASAASQALGELAFMKVRNSEFVIDVPVDDVVDLLLSQCQSRQSLFVLTAVEYVSKIFNLRKEIYQKIFPVFLSLQDNGHPGVVQYVALVLTAIVCENKAEFASRVNPKTGETIWIVKTKFTEEFLPALLQIMSVPGKVVKEAVTIAVNMVIDNFPEAEVEVGEFLKKAAHKADSEQARIMGISVLGKYARTLEDMELLQVLVKASRDRKSKEMRQRALKALVSVINKFPQPKELNAKQIKCLQYLSFSLLRTSYLRDTVPQVRKYYIGALVAIGTNQYEFGGIFPFLRQLILDSDATNSSIAIRGFFNIMKQYPSHLELYYHYFRGFGFSPHDITRRILKEEIRHILELTGTIEYVLPTILLLTGDQDRDIRQSAFEDFKTLIDKYPDRVNYFGQLLLKMTRDKNFHIRADSIEVIATFLDKYPNAGEESEDLFQAFIDLSRDPIKSVRHQVAKYVADVVQLVTPDQVNFIFQALFRFIREEDRGMKEHTLNGFRAAAAIFPDRVPDILADLQRINKREQVASLQELISEFKQFLAEQKASRKKK